MAKEALPGLVGEFTSGVADASGRPGRPAATSVDAIHANYWLSGIAGHTLKHDLGVPLISTFHTLDRVKAEASPEELVAAEPARRAQAEAEIIGCSDAVLASCSVEADQLVTLYGADPGPDRDRGARAWTGPSSPPATTARPGGPSASRPARPLLLFVGRIQPLKALDVAVEALGGPRQRTAGVGHLLPGRAAAAVSTGPTWP